MFNGLEHLVDPKLKFSGMYMAEVIDDEDQVSSSSGRVKVRVFPMMTGLDVAVLPWAIPAFGLFEGGSVDAGAFTVPAKKSKVWVFFAAGDVRSPVYFAAALGMSDGPAGAGPDKKIWKSRSGHTITISDEDGSEEIIVAHKDGIVIKLEKDGKVAIGTSEQELLDLVEQTLTALEQSTVNTQLGPQQLSKVIDGTVTTIKADLDEIKGSV